MMGDEAAKWFLRHHFRNHGLTVLRYFLKRGFIETLVKAYNICVTMVAQGHRHQLSIPRWGVWDLNDDVMIISRNYHITKGKFLK